jgi:hypothetical protein
VGIVAAPRRGEVPPLSWHVVGRPPVRLDLLEIEGLTLFAGMARAGGTFGPGGEYKNRIFVLDRARGIIQPDARLQRGVTDEMFLNGAWGAFPESATLSFVNYGNTAWEQATVAWREDLGEWVWSRGSTAPVSPRLDEGLVDLIGAGGTSGVRHVPVSPHEVYRLEGACSPGASACSVEALAYACSPRRAFTPVALPTAYEQLELVTVPGMALASEAGHAPFTLVVEGEARVIDSPEPDAHIGTSGPVLPLRTMAGVVFFRGTEGLYRLDHDGFHRVLSWSTKGKWIGVNLPTERGVVWMTGLLAFGPDDLLMTTWDGKTTEIRATRPGELQLKR